MSLQKSIAAFSTGTYAVTRTAAGSYTAGRYAIGGTSSFNIDASVQPVSGRDLQNLPESQHANEIKVVYTTTELRTRTPTHEPDQLTIDAEIYEVIKTEKWEGLGTHYRAFASRTVTP